MHAIASTFYLFNGPEVSDLPMAGSSRMILIDDDDAIMPEVAVDIIFP